MLSDFLSTYEDLLDKTDRSSVNVNRGQIWSEINEETNHLNPDFMKAIFLWQETTQWAFTCSKLTLETLDQGVKYVQS